LSICRRLGRDRDWRRDYNQSRPHSNLGQIPPAQFAEQHRQHTADAAIHDIEG
jgi:transposase InsO family protein